MTEAIVNAVAHRDYTDNGSVQVMLFADRLEVRSPGRLPPSLTLENLRVPHGSGPPSTPCWRNPSYLGEYIERMGTGTLDMINRCVEAGLAEPEFAIADGFVATVHRPQNHVCLVTLHCDRKRLEGIDILAVFPSGTWQRATTDQHGETRLELPSSHLSMTVFAAAAGFAAGTEYDWTPTERTLSLQLVPVVNGGRVWFPERTGSLPGLAGRLHLTWDTHDHIRLCASDMVIDGGRQQPVDCVLGDDLHLADADGHGMLLRVMAIVGQSVLMEHRAMRSPSNGQPESLEAKTLGLLTAGPRSRAVLARNLGQKTISGQLNRVVRQLVAHGALEFALPDKPRSRLQKYRLTAKGKGRAIFLKDCA